MAQIKGRYVALVEINLHVDESEEGLLPFDKMYNEITEGLTPMLREVIQDEIGDGDGTDVAIIQMFADAWREEKL